MDRLASKIHRRPLPGSQNVTPPLPGVIIGPPNARLQSEWTKGCVPKARAYRWLGWPPKISHLADRALGGIR
jgi:hypothetical protein